MSTFKTSYTYTASMCVQLKSPLPLTQIFKEKTAGITWDSAFSIMQSVPEVLQHIHL